MIFGGNGVKRCLDGPNEGVELALDGVVLRDVHNDRLHLRSKRDRSQKCKVI